MPMSLQEMNAAARNLGNSLNEDVDTTRRLNGELEGALRLNEALNLESLNAPDQLGRLNDSDPGGFLNSPTPLERLQQSNGGRL